MPKETVQYPTTDGPAGTEISVHWSKDNLVQLHIQRHVWMGVPDPDGVVTHRIGEPQQGDQPGVVAAVGAPCDCQHRPCEHPGGIDPASIPAELPDFLIPGELWTDVLDRSQINTLIRVLRRARDQAYGRDE